MRVKELGQILRLFLPCVHFRVEDDFLELVHLGDTDGLLNFEEVTKFIVLCDISDDLQFKNFICDFENVHLIKFLLRESLFNCRFVAVSTINCEMLLLLSNFLCVEETKSIKFHFLLTTGAEMLVV